MVPVVKSDTPQINPPLQEGAAGQMVLTSETVAGKEILTIEERFSNLVRQWKEATRFFSSIHDMVRHPAYQQIIGMGKDALPLLIKELRREPDHWFVALQAITGINPIPMSAAGNMDKMTEAWLIWAERNGL